MVQSSAIIEVFERWYTIKYTKKTMYIDKIQCKNESGQSFHNGKPELLPSSVDEQI